MTEILRQRIDKQEIADALIVAAKNGNVIAQKYIFDRLDGMPRQSIEVSGGDKPVGLIFVNPGTTEISSTAASS